MDTAGQTVAGDIAVQLEDLQAVALLLLNHPDVEDSGGGGGASAAASTEESDVWEDIQRHSERLAAAAAAAAGQSGGSGGGGGSSAAAGGQAPEAFLDIGDADLGPVRVLKELFTRQWRGAAMPGVPHAVFTERLAPVLLPHAPRSLQGGVAQRIDTDANGIIDWEEFSSFLLLDHHSAHSSDAAAAAAASAAAAAAAAAANGGGDAAECLYASVEFAGGAAQGGGGGGRERGASQMLHAHKDSVHRILCTPDRYFTASLDGTVKVWSPATLGYVATLRTDSSEAKARPSYISDIAHLQASNRIGIFQMDRTVTLYDAATLAVHRMYKGVGDGSKCSTMVCKERFRELDNDEAGSAGRIGASSNKRRVEVLAIEGMQYAPMCAEAASPAMRAKLAYSLSEPVFIGLEKGYVQLFNFRKESGREADQSLWLHQQWRPHTSWVMQMQCCEKLDSLITLSMDQVLKVFNMEKAQEVQSLDGANMECSILGFEYSEEINMIATWGASTVSLWNPTLSSPTRLKMKAGVTQVRFNAADRHAVILTEDRMVSVYDTRSSRCLQQICAKPALRSDSRLTALSLDPRRGHIVTAASAPVVHPSLRAPPSTEEERALQQRAGSRAHAGVVTGAFCNGAGDQLVTADAAKVVVWDLCTGEKMASWRPADAITAFAPDTGLRRAIVAAPGGAVSVYNCMNGEHLKSCVSPHSFDIGCVLHIECASGGDAPSTIAAGGSSAAVLLWNDVPGDYTVPLRAELSLPAHWGHVHSMCQCGQQRMAVGSTSGGVAVYNLSSAGSALTVLHAGVSRPREASAWPDGASSSPPPTGGVQQPMPGDEAETAFNRFKQKTQRGLSNIIEHLVVLTPAHICCLHGSGRVVLWRCGKREGSELVSSFHGAHAAGDEAYALACDREAEEVVVGDASGHVTTFAVSGALAAQAKRPGDINPHPFSSPARRAGGRGVSSAKRGGGGGERRDDGGASLEAATRHAETFQAVRVTACCRPHTAVITAVAWVGVWGALVVFAADREPTIVTKRGVHLASLYQGTGFPLRTPPPPPPPKVEAEDEEEEEEAEEDVSAGLPVDERSAAGAGGDDALLRTHQWTVRTLSQVAPQHQQQQQQAPPRDSTATTATAAAAAVADASAAAQPSPSLQASLQPAGGGDLLFAGADEQGLLQLQARQLRPSRPRVVLANGGGGSSGVAGGVDALGEPAPSPPPRTPQPQPQGSATPPPPRRRRLQQRPHSARSTYPQCTQDVEEPPSLPLSALLLVPERPQKARRRGEVEGVLVSDRGGSGGGGNKEAAAAEKGGGDGGERSGEAAIPPDTDLEGCRKAKSVWRSERGRERGSMSVFFCLLVCLLLFFFCSCACVAFAVSCRIFFLRYVLALVFPPTRFPETSHPPPLQLSWRHERDFTPRSLFYQRPPTLLGTPVLPHPVWGLGGGRTTCTPRAALRADDAHPGPTAGAGAEAVGGGGGDGSGGGGGAPKKKFFSQFKGVRERKSEDCRLGKMMAESQAMQATCKATCARPDHTPSSARTPAFSYAKLMTSPLRTVQSARPYSDSHKNRRRNQMNAPFQVAGGNPA